MENRNLSGHNAVAQTCARSADREMAEAALACDQRGATSALRSAQKFRNAGDVLRHKANAHPRYATGGEPPSRFLGVWERLRVAEKLRVLEADRRRLGLRVGLEDHSPLALLPLTHRPVLARKGKPT